MHHTALPQLPWQCRCQAGHLVKGFMHAYCMRQPTQGSMLDSFPSEGTMACMSLMTKISRQRCHDVVLCGWLKLVGACNGACNASLSEGLWRDKSNTDKASETVQEQVQKQAASLIGATVCPVLLALRAGQADCGHTVRCLGKQHKVLFYFDAKRVYQDTLIMQKACSLLDRG